MAAHLACIARSSAASVLSLVMASGTEVARLEAACSLRPQELVPRTRDRKVSSANPKHTKSHTNLPTNILTH